MRSRAKMIVTAAAACMLLSALVACSDNDPILAPVESPPPPLAQMTFGWGFGSWADSVQHVVMRIYRVPAGLSGDLATVYLDEHQQGDTLTFDRETPIQFARFVDMLTNGFADTVAANLNVWAQDGGMQMGGSLTPEADMLVPRAGHMGVDLADTVVSRVELTLDRLRIEVPGSDRNDDGRWIDVHAIVTLSVY